MLAISVDDVEHNRRVVEGLELEFPILSDSGRSLIRAWGLVDPGGGIGGADIARPATFILDEKGVISWRNLSTNWRIRTSPEEMIQRFLSPG